MTNDWALRIAHWRKRAGLTQEQVAGLFRVDERTIRRWEQGKTRPPEDVRLRLARTSVPLVKRPEVVALAEMTRTSPLGTMLMDENLNIIAISERERQFWLRQYGRDLTGQNWEPYIPPFFQSLFESHGGWRKAIQSGAASLTGDFRIPLPGNEQLGQYVGRVQYTLLRMADGVLVHNYVATSLPPDAVLHPARLTFIDEIHEEE